MNSIQIDDDTVTIDGVVYKRVEEPETKKDEASPRPWRLGGALPGTTISCDVIDEKDLVCSAPEKSLGSYEYWPANRDLILKAVNNFDAMMEILNETGKCTGCVSCMTRAKDLLTDMGELT